MKKLLFVIGMLGMAVILSGSSEPMGCAWETTATKKKVGVVVARPGKPRVVRFKKCSRVRCQRGIQYSWKESKNGGHQRVWVVRSRKSELFRLRVYNMETRREYWTRPFELDLLLHSYRLRHCYCFGWSMPVHVSRHQLVIRDIMWEADYQAMLKRRRRQARRRMRKRKRRRKRKKKRKRRRRRRRRR